MPQEAEADPDSDRIHTLAPLHNLVSRSRALAGTTVTYISSGGTIYGNAGRDPVDELQPPRPIGAYGRTRLQAERLLSAGAGSGDFRLRILRCSNVYGPNQPNDRSQGAVAVFMNRIRHGVPIDVFGEGETFRDYVHVDDVVDATADLWSCDGPDLVNCGSGRPVTINGLIETLELAVGRKAVVNHLEARQFDVDGVVLDISRIEELIGFKPVDLRTGLGLGVTQGTS